MITKNLIPLFTLFCVSLTSCVKTGSTTTEDGIGDDYYGTVEKRAAFNKQDERNFFEDFTNQKIDDNVWYALEGAWHNTEAAAPHNGMKYRNLFFTSDENGNDYLAIRGRGIYNRDSDFDFNKPEGGAIITKKHL